MDQLEKVGSAQVARKPAPPHLDISFFEFVALSAALMALTALSIDIMLPALPAIGSALHIMSENDRQLIIILYMAGFAAGQLVCGPLSDRFGRKPVLLTGLAVFIVGTCGALASSSFEGLLAARLIQGIGAASPRIVAVAVIRDLYSGRQMARVMSFAMMVFILIPVLAPSLGQGLLHFGDWHLTFVALLVLGLAVAVWSGLRLPETSTGKSNADDSIWHSLRAVVMVPQTVGYGAAGGFIFGCLLAYVASAQQVYVEVFKVGAAFPIWFGAVASVMALSSFVNATLVERLGMRRVSHTAVICLFALSLVLTTFALMGSVSLMLFAILVSSCFFLVGMIGPNFNALAMEPQGRHAGMASSVVGFMSTAIGAVVGGVIGSTFHGTVLPLALGFTGCSVITLAIILGVEGRSGMFGQTGDKSLPN
jgi:MFS transporter, DHA1 family, multidrug resistance protein